MRTSIVIGAVLALTFAGSVFGAEKGKKSPKNKEFPDQPFLNSAVNSLTAAQKEVTGISGDLSKAGASLENAETKLTTGMARADDKGNLQIALRLTREAIKDLKGGLKEEAARHIEKALEAARTAGKSGRPRKGSK